MSMSQFSISESLKFGWNATITHVWLILRIILMLFLMGLLMSFMWGFALLGTYLSSFMGDNFMLMQYSQSNYLSSINISLTHVLLMGGALFLISSMIHMWFMLGIIRIGLNIYDTQIAQLSDLFKEWRLIGSALIAKCIYLLLIGIGLLLFVVPGLYALVTFWFYQHAIVDKQLGPIAALQYSRGITKGCRLQLFGFFIVNMVIISLSSAVFGIGLLLASPILILANIYVYRKLIYYKEHVHA